MDTELLCAIAESNESRTGFERIGLLLRQAETIDPDAVERLPAIAAEIESISQRLSYEKGGAESLLVAARYHAMKDDYTEAIRTGETACKRFEEARDAMGRVKALSILGYSFGQLGRLEAALGHFQNGLKLFDEGGFTGADAEAVRANLLNNLASIYGDMGRLDEALAVLQEVQRQAETVGGAPLVLALSNLSEANLKKGNVMNALVYSQRALMEIRTKNLGNMHLHLCHMSFGRIYEQSGQPEKALASYSEALEAARRMSNRYSTANALLSVGALRLKAGSRAEAAEALGKALATAEEIRASELQRSVHALLVELHEQAEEYREAYVHLKRYVEVNAALQTRELERRLGNSIAELRIEQSRKDAEIYRLKNVELKAKSDEIERKAAELEESNRNIRAIGEIGQRITNSLDVEMVLNTVYESVSTLMQTDIFAIGLYDNAMEIVDYRLLVEGGRRLPLIQVSAEDGGSIAARAIAAGREIVLDGASGPYTENAALPGAAEAGRRPESVVCCPLTLSDRVTGVIVVQSFSADAYTARNMETIKALASYIAIALNNSQQSEELRAKAKELELASRTDTLTGLYNRRHVLEKIDEECIRYQRSARPFSVIICDIDLFKKVNDVYGHDCGDAVLKALAALLRRHIRKQDCLARWGGEEFLMLLPETNASGATILAEKLRRRVEENEFVYAGLKLPVTMTFGVAEYLSDYGIDACIVGADSALYKGKKSGRNCVVTF